MEVEPDFLRILYTIIMVSVVTNVYLVFRKNKQIERWLNE